MAYISPSPGVATKQVILYLETNIALTDSTITLTGAKLSIPALQDITINAANDVMTWSQLDSSAKYSVATTSTNSIDGNLVVDKDTFFGTVVNAVQDGTATQQGLLGMSRNKTLVSFAIKFMEDSSADRWITGQGYITNLAPTVSADSPVWVTPFSISCVGEYRVDTDPTA